MADNPVHVVVDNFPEGTSKPISVAIKTSEVLPVAVQTTDNLPVALDSGQLIAISTSIGAASQQIQNLLSGVITRLDRVNDNLQNLTVGVRGTVTTETVGTPVIVRCTIPTAGGAPSYIEAWVGAGYYTSRSGSLNLAGYRFISPFRTRSGLTVLSAHIIQGLTDRWPFMRWTLEYPSTIEGNVPVVVKQETVPLGTASTPIWYYLGDVVLDNAEETGGQVKCEKRENRCRQASSEHAAKEEKAASEKERGDAGCDGDSERSFSVLECESGEEQPDGHFSDTDIATGRWIDENQHQSRRVGVGCENPPPYCDLQHPKVSSKDSGWRHAAECAGGVQAGSRSVLPVRQRPQYPQLNNLGNDSRPHRPSAPPVVRAGLGVRQTQPRRSASRPRRF